MKFIDKYAWAKPGEVVGDILRCDKADNCCKCGTLTPFAEVNAEAYFCSDECVEKFYMEIDEYIRTHPDYNTNDNNIFGELN